MKIGIDAVPLQKLHGGVNYYIFFLLDELIRIRPNDTFFLFTNQRDSKGDIRHFDQYKNVQIVPLFPFFAGHSIWAQTALCYGCRSKQIDVFWGTTQSIPLLIKSSTKTMITLYDFVYLLCPETMSIFKKIYLKLFCRRMLRKADLILPISQGTGMKLKELYGLDYHTVISPPLKPEIAPKNDIAAFLLPHGLTPQNYLMTIGTLEPRKNLQELIEVYLEVLQQFPSTEVLPLVIVGGGGWKNKKLLETITAAQKQYPRHFHLLGYRTDSEIASFLSGARYHLMVSKYEGYGMPIAEARMCQTLSVCLDQPEMREAAENDGCFLNPKNWKEEVKSYLLTSSEKRKAAPTTYSLNAEKASKLSTLINSLCKDASWT